MGRAKEEEKENPVYPHFSTHARNAHTQTHDAAGACLRVHFLRCPFSHDMYSLLSLPWLSAAGTRISLEH